MKSSRRTRFPSFTATTTTTVVYTHWNDHPATAPSPEDTEIPIKSPPPETTSTSVLFHQSPESSAAVKIQYAYRSHAVRALVRKISAVDSEANYWQRLIQRQETVDAVRTSQRERIKVNEALMGLLFRLDSVTGLYPNVRELRRHVSRKIVGLQEILDAVVETKVDHWDGFLWGCDDIVATIGKQVRKEKGGGDEMERFCAEHLGFQCMQRFLCDY